MEQIANDTLLDPGVRNALQVGNDRGRLVGASQS